MNEDKRNNFTTAPIQHWFSWVFAVTVLAYVCPMIVTVGTLLMVAIGFALYSYMELKEMQQFQKEVEHYDRIDGVSVALTPGPNVTPITVTNMSNGIPPGNDIGPMDSDARPQNKRHVPPSHKTSQPRNIHMKEEPSYSFEDRLASMRQKVEQFQRQNAGMIMYKRNSQSRPSSHM